jgi:hypothetical protein
MMADAYRFHEMLGYICGYDELGGVICIYLLLLLLWDL